MTEDEYIQSIRDTAQRYIEVIRDPSAHPEDGYRRMQHWEAVKQKLSAHTLIKLCDLWADRRTHDAVVKAALRLDAYASEFDGELDGELLNALWDACEKHRAHIAAQPSENRAPAGEEASAATMEA
jgi:hypothetical protein